MDLFQCYRPKCLDDILGQPGIVRSLKQYAADPYPAAMLFHGESGCGKSSGAVALAYALGCAVEEQECGGLFVIPSGSQTGDSVKDVIRSLHFRPMMGSGWRVLIVNECDRMSPAAEVIWLDALEAIPPKSSILFTTNCPEKLSERFRQRCDLYAFTSSTEDLRPHIRAFAQRVWKEQVGKGRCPGLNMIGMPTLQGMESMHASFRLAIQQLNRLVREAKAAGVNGNLEVAVSQMVADGAVSAEGSYATCDHCQAEIKLPTGAKKVRCPKCRKVTEVE